MVDCLILGGGAAGLAAAILIKEREPSLTVTVLERNDRVGKKLAVTGNGQCNIANRMADASCYHGDPALAESVLERFPFEEQKRFFGRMGLPLTEKEDGKVYPHALQATAVVDALRFRAEECGVAVQLSAAVTQVTYQDGRFCAAGDFGHCSGKTLLVACGGEAGGKLGSRDGYAILKSFGHRITPLTPAIVQLRSADPLCRSLAGIKLPARLTAAGITTPVTDFLFCDYGISGPGVLTLSSYRTADKPLAVTVDLVPDLKPEETAAYLSEKCRSCPSRPTEELLAGLIHRKVGMMLCKRIGLDLHAPLSSLTEENLAAVNTVLHRLVLDITDTNGMANAQVTAGGADTAEFDRTTLMSKKVSGLFAAGEVLHVDGNCGGYNLSFAWASASAAADGMIAWCRR